MIASNIGNMAMRLALAVSLIGLLFMAHPETTYACSCAGSSSPAEALEAADAVFQGRVVSIKGIRDETSYAELSRTEFDVETSWKGTVHRTMYIGSRSHDVGCGYPFINDEEYIVYAYYSEQRGGLWTGLCTRTTQLAWGTEDLAELGEGNEPREGENASPWELSGGCSRSAEAVDLAFVGLVAGLVWSGLRKRGSKS